MFHDLPIQGAPRKIRVITFDVAAAARQNTGRRDARWRLCLRTTTFVVGLAMHAVQAQTAPSQPLDHRQELEKTQQALDASAERRKAIQAEIESIREDHVKLKQTLIDVTRQVGDDERTIADTQAKLDVLVQNEQATKRSLDGRRAIIAEVLAALQRMGRKPPPALLVDPNDILKAIRTSMLLGSVLPDMKLETEALIADLTDLAHVHASIDQDKRKLAADLLRQQAQRERLAALIDARQAAIGKAEEAMAAERDHAETLAGQALSLKELITRMEATSKPAADAADAARKADEQLKTVATLTPDATLKLGGGPPRDPARLAPSVAFASLRGNVPVPVTGSLLRPFGAPDGFGGFEKGMSFKTATGAVVASPSDGWIAYAGPYRSLGQLVIINAGGGYYIVLAGMDRINVDLGQFVLAGEPIAAMGDGSAKTAAALALGADLPILYVEFRKDGATIDPGPWVGETGASKGSRIMRKVSLVVLGAVLGASTVTLGTQARFFSTGAASAAASDTYRSLNLFGDVFEKIRTDYVEKPDDQKLAEAAINGMLTSLDPHSSYMDAKSFRDMQVQTRGEFGGLGIEVTQDDTLIKVVTPIDDTPASKAGILSGDIISAIDGEAVSGLTLNQAVDKMRGAVNTPVTLKILRGPKKDAQDITLTRAVITIKSVRNKIEGDDIGYIRITQFNEQTFDGVKEAIEKFNKEIPADRFKGYIVDLRNNPGGLLDQSIAVSNAFLDKGEIVSTRGRNADETQRYNARPGDISKGRPLVIMINGGSASASEIVAGALQDHKRATILGTRSFGKGSVQTIIPLGQANGAVRLTTARYYTPSGRSIQAKGIEPDIQVLEDIPADLKGKDDTKGEASLKGHLTNGPEEHGSSAYVPPDPKNDQQLIAAEDLLRGVKKAASSTAAPVPASAPATTVPAGAPMPAAPTTGGTPTSPPPAAITK